MDDHALSVQPTNDGGLLIGGHTRSFGAGDWDFYLVKLDTAQQVQWTRTVGGANVDNCFSVQQTSDGGYLASGHTNSFGMGGYDFYVVKVDGDGNLLWTRTIGGIWGEFAFSLKQTSDGGCVITGSTNSFGAGNYDVYVVKLDGDGNLEWTRTVGGAGADEGRSVWQTSDGGYVIGGWTSNYGSGGDDVYVVKLDGQGDLEWTRTVGGPGLDRAYAVQQVDDGGFVAAGFTSSFGQGSNDVYVVRLDPDGNLLWTKTIGGADDDQGMSVQQTSDLGFVITGTTRSFGSGDNNVYTLKLNAAGSLEWGRAIIDDDGQDYSFQVFQASSSGYVIGGYSQPYGTSAYDMYLMKLDHEGNACGTTESGGSVGSGGVSGSGGVENTGGAVGTGGTEASGGAVTEQCSAVGIGDIAPSGQAALFPNPANDRLTITGLRAATVVVHDALGRQLDVVRNVFGQAELNTAAWAPGAYFVELLERDGSRSVHKVVIDR
jgi:uncharacterized delta-60 repeat protein